MSIKKVSAGNKLPEEINVIVEIPDNSSPVKYEVDKESGTLFVDRFMISCMHYPCNYGYVPQTLSEDSDPVDVLVVCQFPLLSGSVVRCRPIGILNMEDEAGPDSKILAVPVSELTEKYDTIQSYEDLPRPLIRSIEHFFNHYKDLEEGKWVKIFGWTGPKDAHHEILESVERYKKQER